MSIKVNIPFEDPAQHLFGPLARVSDGVGGLANLFPITEMFFFNFDEDGSPRSKRGGADIEFFGADNDGEILDGWLKIGKNNKSYAGVLNRTLTTPNKFAIRTDYKLQVDSFSGNKPVIVIKNKSDSSMIEAFFAWGGSGAYRLYFQVWSATGPAVYSVLALSRPAVPATIVNVGISFDKSGEFRMFLDGELAYAVDASTWDVNFTDVDVTFGGRTNSATQSIADLTNIQFINDAEFASVDTIGVGEQFSRSQIYQYLITISPFLMHEFKKFAASYRNYLPEEFRHTLMLNSKYIFWKQATLLWEEVRNPAVDLNTMEEIADHVADLQIQGGNGAFIQLVTWVKSVDGYTNPEITDLDIEYSYYFSLGTGLSKCIVIGSVVNNSGEPVEGAKVYFDDAEDDYFEGDHLIAASTQTLTGPNGKFDIEVVETETSGKKVDCYVSYQDVDKNGKEKTIKRKYLGLTIPNLVAEAFAKIVKDSQA